MIKKKKDRGILTLSFKTIPSIIFRLRVQQTKLIVINAKIMRAVFVIYNKQAPKPIKSV